MIRNDNHDLHTFSPLRYSLASSYSVTEGRGWRKGEREGRREGGREGGREEGRDSNYMILMIAHLTWFCLMAWLM